MGVQLIFVVETNKKCNSDWIYIKDTIEYFYEYDNAHVKLSPVYMDGKGHYIKAEKEVKKLISQYNNSAKGNKTEVIYCFDCDEYDTKPEDAEFLQRTKKFCADRGYNYVWFCKDIERVFLGNKVTDAEKKNAAAAFKAKKKIRDVQERKLSCKDHKNSSSNILIVLDAFVSSLKRK